MVKIRYADYSDYESILSIDKSISNKKWKCWTDNRQAVLIFDNDELAGWLQYSFFIEKIPFVNRLYVFEKFQRRSLGTGLMKFWEFEMIELGYTKFMLSTNHSNTALDFYKGLGYKQLGTFNYFGEHNELILGKEASLTNTCCSEKQ